MSCSSEDLEALARGELSGARAGEVEAHAAECAECRAELSSLRAEIQLFARRRIAVAPLPPSLWNSVQLRVVEPPVRAFPAWTAQRRWMATAAAGMAIALGGATVGHLLSREPGRPRGIVVRVHDAKEAVGDGSDQVLAEAEAEYLQAAAELEREYQERRPRLTPTLASRTDRALAETRAQMAQARADARDVDGRMRLLDGYADYVHSLQTVVYEVNR